MPVRSMVRIMPMLLSAAASRESDPAVAVFTLDDLLEATRFDERDIHAFLDHLIQRDVLRWKGYEARCPSCGAAIPLGDELPAVVTCEEVTHPIDTCHLDEVYFLALEWPTSEPSPFASRQLTPTALADTIFPAHPADEKGVQILEGPAPRGIHVRIVEAGQWQLTAILGRIAFTLYGARSQQAYDTLQATLTHDLGGAANYAALEALQHCGFAAQMAASLVAACRDLGELPRLAEFCRTIALVPAWRVDRHALETYPAADVDERVRALLASAFRALGPECYLLSPLPGLVEAASLDGLQVFAFPATVALVRQVERTLPVGWCLTSGRLLIASPCEAWWIWSSQHNG